MLFRAIVTSTVLGAGLMLVSATPAQAAMYPGTGAPQAIQDRLAPDPADPENLFAYPFLRNLAKSLARSGIPPRFFLDADAKPHEGPWIDLRVIMLNEAGILHSPVRLLVPGKKAHDDKLPKLSVPQIPDAPLPQTAKRGEPAEGAASPTLSLPQDSGPADGASNKDAAKGQQLSIDFNRFSGDFPAASHKGPQVALTVPGKERLSPESILFRLWTVRDETLVPPEGSRSARSEYNGSFIVVTPGTLSAVEGRVFQVKQGRLLAASSGKALTIVSPSSTVTVEPGSAAAVELAGDTMCVKVLESRESKYAVNVRFESAGGTEQIRLTAGDELLVSNKKLTGEDRALIEQGAEKSGGDNWAKGKFSPKRFAGKDLLTRTDLPRMSAEQRYAIEALCARLKK